MTDEGGDMAKVWFITGANRGLGLALVNGAKARGATVVGTARDAASLSEACDLALPLDVRDTDGVDAAVRTALEAFGRIDVLVNNAGHGLVGAVEELNDAEFAGLLDVNVHGVLRVTRAVLPHMRRQASGHIVQMSSVGGRVANPGHAAYAASKFALEGLSEALAGEVAGWGVRVTIVEPGPFRTDFAGDSLHYTAALDDYSESPAGAMRRRFAEQHGRQPNDPVKGAEAILRAVDNPASPLRLPLGPEAADRIRASTTALLEDLATVEHGARDTRFDDS